MAKIPDYTALGGRPSPQPSLAVVTYRGDNPAATAPGEAAFQEGAALRQAGESLFATQQAEIERRRVEAARQRAEREAEARELRRIDELRAEDAFNELRRKQLELTVGQGGFATVKGAAAVTQDMLGTYTKKFQTVVQDIDGRLGNDQQREFFRRRASIAGLQYEEGLLQHLLREGDAYAKQTFDGTIGTEVMAATASWQDKAAVRVSIERVTAAARTLATDRQLAPELADAMVTEAASKVHSAVIQQAVSAGQFRFAEEYYKENKGQFTPETARAVEVAVRDGTQRELYYTYTKNFLAAQDDPKALKALLSSVDADRTLDERQKNALVGRIQSRQDTLETRARIERERAERRLQAQITAVNTMTLQGYEPTADQMAPILSAARGTALEPQVRQMVATANATRAFRAMAPQEQEVFLTRMEQQARADPTRFDVTMISRLRAIQENQRRDARADPVTFAVRQGFVDPQAQAAQPLDLTKPETLGSTLAQRYSLAAELGARYQVPTKPLTEAEAGVLRTYLNRARGPERLNYFSRLAAATKGNEEAYKAVMAQVAPDDPVTALAGVYAANPMASTAATLMLRGQDVLRPATKEDGAPVGKPWPMPRDQDLLKEFESLTREAFAGKPGARNSYLQAAKSIYAARMVEAGNQSGVLDTDIWEDAVRQATGGVGRYNGKYTLMPYGMSAGDFRDGVAVRIRDVVASGRLDPINTLTRLSDLPLEPVGDGRYVMRSGDAIILDKDRQPVFIDFNAAPGAPAMPSRELRFRGNPAQRLLQQQQREGAQP